MRKAVVQLEGRPSENLLILPERDTHPTVLQRHENDISMLPTVGPTLSYRYQAKMGSVTPRHMKKAVLTDFKKCMLGVSLGSSKSEEDRFEASIRWISENFSSCALIVGDSIYRHTLQITNKLSPEEAAPAALKIGRDFMSAHEPIINRYRSTCHFEWMCMSQVEQHPNFRQYHEAYQDLYEHDSGFHAQVNAGSEQYLCGLSNSQDLLDASAKTQNVDLCANYFVEESAIFTCLCEKEWNVLIYPGTIKPLQTLSDGSITGVPEPILTLNQVRLNLSKKTPYVRLPERQDTSMALSPAYGYSDLAGLKEKAWSQLLQYSQLKSFQSGDIVSHFWGNGKALGIVYKGNVAVLTGNIEIGATTQVDTFGAVSFLGELNFLLGVPFTKTVVALTEGEILLLDHRTFRKMQRAVPETAGQLAYHMARVLSFQIHCEEEAAK